MSLGLIRSGINGKAVDRVIHPQIWPQAALQGEYVSQNIKFADLDFRLFSAGELEIITSSGQVSRPLNGVVGCNY